MRASTRWLSSLVAAVALAPASRADGYQCAAPSDALPPKVVRGHDAASGDAPWQAEIMVERSAKSRTLCGGSLIDARWILTAAHCVSEGRHPVDQRQVTVRYGSLVRGAGRPYGVERIVVPPQWDGSVESGGDIALIRLADEVAGGTPVALALDAASDTPLVKDGTCALVTGWGRTRPTTATGSSDSVALRLQKTQLPIVSGERCNTLRGRDRLRPSVLCAGFDVGRTDTCRGDSGGALVVRDRRGNPVQVGVASITSPACATAGEPSAYTRVAAFGRWLCEVMDCKAGVLRP